MKTAIGIGGAASGSERDFEPAARFVVEAERLGVDAVWSAEAWGQDAVAPIAFVAARTTRILIGTGIMQISARTPSMTAMTALTLAALSNDRFILGLGASGPQVVEGLQGRPFAHPLGRMRETIEIVRLALRGADAHVLEEHLLGLLRDERRAEPAVGHLAREFQALGAERCEVDGDVRLRLRAGL